MPVDLTYADQAVARIGRRPEALIPILQALQDHYGYLPEEALRRVCETSDITPAAVSGVSSFYDMFRHQPAGKHIIQVCHGTACHVGGAERAEDALRRHLSIRAGTHTDPSRQFTIEPVACLGCCTLAPVVRIGSETIGYVAPEKVPGSIREFLANQRATPAINRVHPASKRGKRHMEIKVCLDSCCVAKGTDRMFQALQKSVAQAGVNATVKHVGCVGACYRTPMVEVAVPGKSNLTYTGLTPGQADELIQVHCRPRGLTRRI